MEKQQTLLKKYESMVMEWNTLSLICGIAFAATFIGLVLGLLYTNFQVIFISMVIMLVFSLFEYSTRKKYVHIKEELEHEMFRMARMKNPKIRNLIRKGMWW
jgi:hypothetical protein